MTGFTPTGYPAAGLKLSSRRCSSSSTGAERDGRTWLRKRIADLFRDWAGSAYHDGTPVRGAQTVRRGGAGPVRDSLGGKTSPAACFFSQVFLRGHATSFAAAYSCS